MSNVVYLLHCLVFSSGCVMSQDSSNASMEPIRPLPDQLKECSGMITMGNGYYLGNNDSGNPAELFLFTMDKNADAKRIHVAGASNVDWEELASSDEYIYIGDIGNNTGNRKDLCIYRVKRDEIFAEVKVSADKIQFSYPKQTKFKSGNKHNFDCEAMVSVGDSLFLFTKNRGNGKTDLYGLPNKPGNYEAKHLGSFDAKGLITGADYRVMDSQGELVLIGYMDENKGYHPFVFHFANVLVPGFFESKPTQYIFKGKLQTETILFDVGNNVLITNEEEHGDKGYIYRVNLR